MDARRAPVSPRKKRAIVTRKYATTACEPCKKRHAKCDGTTPVCSRCRERALQCTYPITEDGRRPAPKSYVKMLRNRIDVLERTLEAHSIDVETAVARTLSSTAGTDAQGSSNHGPNFVGSLSRDAQLNFDHDGEARYFGISSGRLEFSNSTLDTRQGQPAASNNSQRDAARLRINRFCQDTIQEQLISPELEEELIQIYFKWEQPWDQVVDEKLFRDHRATQGKYFSPLLLNCILAVASRLSHRKELRSNPDDPKTAGVYFLEKAEILLHYELRWPSITTLQSLCILGVAYVAVGSDAAGWLHAGMATILAVDMGLNLDPANVASTGWLKPEEIELRRRIYWTLYCLDKLSSLYMGRVCTVLYSQANVLPPATSRPAMLSKSTPAEEASFYFLGKALNSLVGVCRIIEQILVALYSPKSRMQGKERDMFVSTMLLDLKSWYYDLPKELNLEYHGIVQDQPAIYTLHMVYHTSIILLMKPTLLASQDKSARKISYQAAVDICNVASRYRRKFSSFRQSPITATHCTLSAVLILINANNNRWQGTNPANNNRNIDIGLTVLEELSDSWYPAKRIRQSLVKLHKPTREIATRGSVPRDSSTEESHEEHSGESSTPYSSSFADSQAATSPVLQSAITTSETEWPPLDRGENGAVTHVAPIGASQNDSLYGASVDDYMFVGSDFMGGWNNFSYMETNPLFLSDALPNDYSGFDILNRIQVQRP
ncbi:hypothetical protein M426DRAFT_316032 [Hypoxylon sp. CI-4A]|nr:hypothetical protein M426DRAFT_316032 [Hypoxylon sp. CI-4A]